MADPARDYIRQAQEAEIAGDRSRAAELLRAAAHLYQERGAQARAEQLLRHAARLADVGLLAVERPADRPQGELAQVVPGGRALDARRFTRGPARADPAVAPWCSFCCRPTQEAGPMVAGPAGAFICERCLAESSVLLGGSDGAVTGRLEPSSRSKSPSTGTPRGVAPDEWIGQGEAVALLDVALRLEPRVIALVGPSGCGKSALLARLEGRGAGSTGPLPPERGRWLVELDEATALEQAAAALRFLDGDQAARLLVAVRGELGSPAFSLRAQGTSIQVYGTSSLVKATQELLPAALAERVQLAVPLRALTAGELEAIARAWLATMPELARVPARMVRLLAAQAAHSVRGAHELWALLGRLPQGEWQLEPGSGKRRRRPGPLRRRRR